MRKYQPIWNKIRDKKKAVLYAPISSHARIILAVRKEKVNDLGYKLMLLDLGIKENLTVVVDKDLGLITFGLVNSGAILASSL